MRGRKEAADYISAMLNNDIHGTEDKAGKWHWGWQDIRHIMDYIYEGEPEAEDEKLINTNKFRKS